MRAEDLRVCTGTGELLGVQRCGRWMKLHGVESLDVGTEAVESQEDVDARMFCLATAW